MDRHHPAAELLLAARRERRRLGVLPDAPQTTEQAYLVQREIMGQLGPIGGWKVGASDPQSTAFTCAPLPAASVLASPAEVAGSDRGIEAEIAVRLGADLPPRAEPYGEAELRAANASAHPAIEVLESRFDDPSRTDKLSLLADSLSNHSLVLGEAIPDWAQVDLAGETVSVLFDGNEIKRRQGNPAGDMIRLLVWLANEGARWAGGLKAGQVVTTGSWTGKDVAAPGQRALIRFARCGEASVRFVA